MKTLKPKDLKASGETETAFLYPLTWNEASL